MLYLETYADGSVVKMSRAVRQELRAVRRILPLFYADTYRCVSPVVFAQDAEGESNHGLGGWGIGYAFPPPAEIVELAMRSIAHGLPDREQLAASNSARGEGSGPISDAKVPGGVD